MPKKAKAEALGKEIARERKKSKPKSEKKCLRKQKQKP